MWKTAALIVAIVNFASDARAQSLRGHWEVRAPSIPDYVGIVLIDGAGRATWDSPNDRAKQATFIGYVARRDGPKVEMLFTNRVRVTRAHCVIQSADVLNCYNVYQSGAPSDGFMLVKIGPGPQNLMPASR